MNPVQKKTNLKICIIGDSGVGKTSLIMRYVKGKFSNTYRITVGADLFSHEVSFEDKNYLLQMWDTAGQERFQTIGTAFYRGSDACIIVYDITQPKSLTNIETWKREFIKQGGIRESESFPFVVIGNKCDKETERAVDKNTALDFCRDNGNMPLFETSAKDDLNVKDAFLEVVRLAAEQHKDEEISVIPSLERKRPDAGAKSSSCC